MNMKKIREKKRDFSNLLKSRSSQKIDAYVDKVQKFLQNMIEKIVSWAKSSRYVKFFWNNKCEKIIKMTRRLKRSWSSTRN
jgi:uncharacterized protein YaaR (DUF327 family)